MFGSHERRIVEKNMKDKKRLTKRTIVFTIISGIILVGLFYGYWTAWRFEIVYLF